MKRLCALMMLMMVSSAADAGSFSFSVGGHRFRVEAPRGCRSSSCTSISTVDKKRDDDTRNVAASPPPPAPAPVQVAPPAATAPAPVQQSAPPAPKPIVAAAPAPAPVYKPPAVATTEVAPPSPPQAPPPVTVTQPCTTPPADKPDETVRPVPASPPLLKVLREEDVDSPVGDWLTEGRGMVRISECGHSLCGYVIKEDDGEKGEAVLINMKAKSDQKWGGSVYSKDSGDTYYGTIRMKGPNMLRVEACAFGRFYCNGNNWTRISTNGRMAISRQIAQEPRS